MTRTKKYHRALSSTLSLTRGMEIWIVIFLAILSCRPSPAQEVLLGNEVRMLALGDSYTIGQSVITEKRWPHQLMEALRNSGIQADDPDYIATTGWTTGDLITGINSRLDTAKSYNLVSVLIGVNNQYQGIPISAYEPELREILRRAVEIVDQDTSRLFLLSIPDYAYTPFGGGNAGISKEIDEYNLIKKRVADEWGLVFIDVTGISREGLSIPSLVASDGLHPSGDQYSRWVQAIMPSLSFRGPGMTVLPGDAAAGRLEAFPNPVTSLLHLVGSAPVSRVWVHDIQGRILSTQALNGLPAQLDFSSLAPGTYFLRFRQVWGQAYDRGLWIVRSG